MNNFVFWQCVGKSSADRCNGSASVSGSLPTKVRTLPSFAFPAACPPAGSGAYSRYLGGEGLNFAQ